MKYTLPLLLMFFGVSFYVYYRGIRTADTPVGVSVSTGTSFVIPKGCKRLALLGCTPHPTVYLSQKNPKALNTLELKDILDLDDLKDSFTQVLRICENNQIDHLLIAYLPIYFVKMRQLLKERFVPEAEAFLKAIAPQIATFIQELKKELDIQLPVSLLIPPKAALEKVPIELVSPEERVRYSIKQFPKLIGIDRLDSLVIINNKGSSQNDGILRYLRYEYLFEPPISYEVYGTQKERFHKYL